jgi:transposase
MSYNQTSAQKHKGNKIPVTVLVALYHGGMSVPELAKQVGLSSVTIYRWLRNAGISLRPRREEPTPVRAKWTYEGDEASLIQKFGE